MPSPIIVDSNNVDSVEDFTYLGSIQSSSSNSGLKYIRRIKLAASAMKRLSCIWSQSKLSIATKLRIYSTCVLSILLSGFKTWTLTQAYWKRLDSFHLRCHWSILHISWYNFASNDEVLHRSGLFDVSYIVRKRRLDLFRSRRQTSKWCTGKPDPPNLYQDEGRWPAFAGVETCQRSFAHHLDPPDLPWHRCYRVTATEALELAEDKPFWRTIATARRFGWSLRVWWWWWW